MGDLSAHFDSKEFRCPDGTTHAIDPKLIAGLEVLRHQAGGRPLRIVSGYRSPSYNASVGGARRSQHLYGRAADVPSGYCRVADAIRAGFTGIGVHYGWVVHVDVRPGKRTIFQD